MNTKNLNFLMTLVFFALLLSCDKNEMGDNSVIPVIHDYRVQDIFYPKDGKLKYVYQVFDTYKNLATEYQYDNLGRISRVNFVLAKRYDIYQYNTKGQLEKISTYDEYLENSPVVIQTINYSYNTNGNKEKEQTNFTDNREPVYNLYKYDGGKLTKQEHYEGNQQKYYIVYEYKDNILLKEKLYVPDEKDFVTTEYFYAEGLFVYSITYNGSSETGFMHDERNYYDRNDNLIKRVDNIPGLSSMSGATVFLVKWEYEYE